MDIYKGHITRLNNATHHDPFEFLGPHPAEDGGWVVRAFLPGASKATISMKGQKEPMSRIRPEDVLSAVERYL